MFFRRYIRCTLATLTVVLVLPGAAYAQRYRAPFVTPPLDAADASAQCPAPPAPIVTLSVGIPYVKGDASYSQVDPALLRARDASLAPVRAFTAGLTRFANTYVRSGGADRRSGTCALRWLGAWARAGAMTRMPDHNAQFARSVALSGWAMDYAQVRGLVFGANDPKPAILAWFTDMATDLRAHTSALTNITARNNHRYWAGFAATAVAMDTGDQPLAAWGLQSARVGLDQVDRSGALPLELTRATLARHYHLYAAAPLVMMAEIGAANGTDLSSYNNGALHRLVAFSLGSITAPGVVTARAGAAQKPFVNLRGSYDVQNVAWFEFYNRRFPGRVSDGPAILSHRPLLNDEIGGNITMLSRPQ